MRDRKGSKESEASLGSSRPPTHRSGRRKLTKPPTVVYKRRRWAPWCMCSKGPWAIGGSVLLSLVVAGMLLHSTQWSSEKAKPRAVTPLPVPLISDLPQFQGKHRERFFWGTYRSTLYLGIRARTPKSLLAGLMWLGVKEGRYSLRHTCEESDKLSKYAWVRHDGANYGRQELMDQGLSITTSFIKSQEPESGYGGDWAIRIQAAEQSRPSEDGEVKKTPRRQVSLFFYVADEAGKALKIYPDMPDGRFAGGTAEEIGGWELHIKGQGKNSVNFVGLRRQHTHNLTQLVWQALEMQVLITGGYSIVNNMSSTTQGLGFTELLYEKHGTIEFTLGSNTCRPFASVAATARTQGRLQLPDGAEKSSNIGVIQITGPAPLDFDLVFVSGTEKHNAQVCERVRNLSGTELTKRFADGEEKFEQRFQSTFQLQKKVQSEREVEVGRVALSNMLGSIGYSYGQSLIAIPPHSLEPESQSGEHWKYWPAALYTAVPSRSFFPRGFLWDEGFHQLLVSQWDRKMSKEIIAHWLDLLNIDGWIPREQILGDEARSKVPHQFVLQHTSNANPPTLFMAIRKLATFYKEEKALGKHNEEDQVFFERLYPRLEVWFQWFNTSQTGKEPSSYYWHGRNAVTERELNPTTLMSGLDDYPRASHPSEDERHLDIRCWMALAAQSMAQVASILDVPNEKYKATAAQLTDLKLLNKLHYDEETGRYLDYGLHTEQVKLQRKSFVDPQTGYVQSEVQRLVLETPELGWVPHYGYNSLFPMLMDIVPLDSQTFGTELDLLRNESNLWTDYGLRSLATSSSLYMKRNTEHDAPYWRGPVWMNINYLTLSALNRCSRVQCQYSSRCNQIYSQLRENLIRNVVNRYFESGFLWEQYDNANDGKGKGSHPFTGWTSLILLIMGDLY